MTTQPWDRRPTETDPAWQAFQAYRDAGPGVRSIPAAVQAVGAKPGKGRVLERWSSRHEWTARVRAWDGFLDQEAQKRIKAKAIERRVRQAELGQAMQGVAGISLSKKAELIRAGKYEPSLHEIAALAKAGFDIETVAEGDPNQILGGPGGGGLEVRLVNIRDLPRPGGEVGGKDAP